MKRSCIIILLSFMAVQGFAQYAVNSISISAGAGYSTNYNYNLGLTGGIDYTRGFGARIALGAGLMYQGYNLLYTNQSESGSAGAAVLLSSGYIFFAPKVDVGIGKKCNVHFYLAPGIGFNMSGKETTRKWNDTYGSVAAGNYDSTINTTANIKKLAFRVNFGFTEYLYLSYKWRFIVTQDFGFLATDLSTTGTLTDGSRTSYTPLGTRPAYISLLLGVDHRGVSKKYVRD